ncbi:MAG: hypothetical protein J2P25_13500 [Nocardiopsaceae bacterium]|nr:hypothetical protein [Nocardiopsaceae bacterium]
MEVSELRFRPPGWKAYLNGIELSAIGLAVIAWGAAVVAWNPWSWRGAILFLSGIGVGAMGAAFTLLTWFIIAFGMVTSWRRWRRLRPPVKIVDASGIHYLSPRRPVFVPWSDVEQVILRRNIFPKRVISSVFIRFAPGAALLRDGTFRVPADHSLSIGPLAAVSVPEDVAVRFLEEIAGPRLEVETEDRRKTVDASGRR